MTHSTLRLAQICFCAVLLLLAGACSTVDVSQGTHFEATDDIALLPIANHTETPDAGHRVQSIAESLLHQKGFRDLQRYPQEDATDLLMSGSTSRIQQEALQWAQDQGIRYALTGSVQEWRYKVGLDGEPVAGISFKLIDINEAKVVWSATGSRSGWSRSSLSGVGQTLIKTLLEPLTMAPQQRG